MRFRPQVPAAYAPAQGATAMDDDQALVLLFVPQWQEIIRQVRKHVPPPQPDSQWAFSREMQMPIWFVRWSSGHELAITFPLEGSQELLRWWQQHGLVDVVLLAEPLPEQAAHDGTQPQAQPTAAILVADEENEHLRLRQVPFMDQP